MKSLFTIALSLAVVAPASATTLLFDFGRTDMQTNPNWNNVVPATTELFALFDSIGNIYSTSAGQAGFAITDPFFQTGEPSRLGSEAPTGDASGYPVDATDDYFFGHTSAFAGADPNPVGEVKLTNLEPGQPYDFTFFASRQTVNDIRDAEYTVTGANTDSGVLNASNNNDTVLRIPGILPDANNEIFVSVTKGPNNNNGTTEFYYIGLMQVDAIPEPSTLLLALACSCVPALARSRRRA